MDDMKDKIIDLQNKLINLYEKNQFSVDFGKKKSEIKEKINKLKDEILESHDILG